MQRYYECGEVYVPWDKMREAHRAGKLILALDETLAIKIANDLSQFTSTRSTIGTAFKLWGCVLSLWFSFCVYLAIVSAWWWALIGVASSGFVWVMHRKGTTQNLLQLAMDDAEFYESVRVQRGWLYRLDEESARILAPPPR